MLRIPRNFVNLQIRPRVLLVAVAGSLLAISGAAAQENPAGPQAPPPEHKIERVIGVAQPESPPRAHPGIRPRWKTRRRIRCHVPGRALQQRPAVRESSRRAAILTAISAIRAR